MRKISKNRIVCAVLTGALWLAGLDPVAGFAEESVEKPDTWAMYKVVVERNMFSRQRGATERRQRDAEREIVTIPDPESYYRLRGITQEDGTFIAFIEDTRLSETLKLRQGDAVARGTIESLDLDSIVYRLEDRTIPVAMGQDLLGGRGAVTMTELMEWTPALPSTSGQEATPAAPAGNEADVLKQLLERRRQELGQ